MQGGPRGGRPCTQRAKEASVMSEQLKIIGPHPTAEYIAERRARIDTEGVPLGYRPSKWGDDPTDHIPREPSGLPEFCYHCGISLRPDRSVASVVSWFDDMVGIKCRTCGGVWGRGGVGRWPDHYTDETPRRDPKRWPTDILAAGGVVWRDVDGDGQRDVLVVHRSRYDQWVFPQCAAREGETMDGCAVRELYQETGITVSLGTALGFLSRRVGFVNQIVEGQSPHAGDVTKYIKYYAMTVTDPDVWLDEPVNDEVDEMRWVTPAEARKLFTYPEDEFVLRWWEARFA